jgi:uncharacterized protein affecting Mg2+/Co2+ transport
MASGAVQCVCGSSNAVNADTTSTDRTPHCAHLMRVHLCPPPSPPQVQLKSRHWVITDASGNTEEVRGPGVVGAMVGA